MKACICPAYGPPNILRIEEKELPTPSPGEIRVRLVATEVTSGDDRIRGAKFPGLFWFPVRMALGFTGPRQQVLGVSFSGVVDALGDGVTRFKLGDAVFGSTGHKMGCHAEYLCVAEDTVVTGKPDSMSHDQAAALFFGGHTALHFLRKGGLKQGDRLLVYGASGCLGTYGIQLGRHMGAHVTAVCSAANADLVRSLGAHDVLDYTDDAFRLPPESFDAVFETLGKADFRSCVAALKPGGCFLRAVHLEAGHIAQGLWQTMFGKRKVVGGEAHETRADLEYLCELVEKGAVKPVIDGRWPLEQIAEAHTRVDSGRKRGSVVVTFE